MKKISATLFFTVLWRGVCQALGWFLNKASLLIGRVLLLFGYQRGGKFAQCVWGLFATSAAVVMACAAIAVVVGTGEELYHWYSDQYVGCEENNCYANCNVYGDIYYHDHEDGKGYVNNIRTGKKLVRNVAWIREPEGKDSLVAFYNGVKCGYFSKHTGEVVIAPKYKIVWNFSEGLAGIVEDRYVKFIDGTGKVVIDMKMAYDSDMSDLVFHSGYCVIGSSDDLYGLIDHTGTFVLPQEYDRILLCHELDLWLVEKGKESAVYDKELKAVIPFMECSIGFDEEEATITMTMPDHTKREYRPDGQLINDFYIDSVRKLEYEKDEILYQTRTHDDDGSEYAVPFVESFHPKATARLRAYVAGDGYEGLMTADGRKVTMPLYWEIEALDSDLYLCSTKNGDKVIVNGKGEMVK